MRRLIQADSEYNRVANFIQWPVVLAMVAANSIWGGMEEAIATAMFFMAIFLGILVTSESAKTRRIRMLSALPLPARTLGLYRLYGLVVGWSTWMALLAASSLISRRGDLGPDYAAWLLTRIGCMFLFAGMMSLSTDVYFGARETKKARDLQKWVVQPLLIAAASIAGPILYMATVPMPGANKILLLTRITQSLPGSVFLLIAGLLVLALDVHAYQRRRSYLEESAWPM
ncbi:MAG: hypothetical protein GXY47_04175 [Acidobacteria bacterium]|nr:hypothetical protein [Acidobacteriota bacterium]